MTLASLLRCGFLGLSCVVAVSTGVERRPRVVRFEQAVRVETMRGAPVQAGARLIPPALLPRDMRDDVATDSADASLVTALTELERQTHDVDSPALRAQFVERARALFTLTADVQLMRGRYAAALWFSDRARQVAMRTFSFVPVDVAGDAEKLGRELINRVPTGVTVVHQEFQDDKLLTWVVRDGDVHLTTKAISREAVTASIKRFRENQANLIDAEHLYDALLRPVHQQTAGSSFVVYSPSPALYGVPFAALHDGESFLIERHAVAVTPSIRTFIEGFAQPAVGGRGSALITLPSVADGARFLPGARDEVRALFEIYGRRASSLLDKDASATSFLAMLSQFDVIHVSSHGATAVAPLENAVEFGDERVCAKAIVNLQLERRPIVVLASCRTSEEKDDATIGLSSAFIAAGASAVVGSLWDIEDLSTKRLMSDFHQRLSQGVSAAESLSLAQRSAIARGERFATWAAFQVQM
jgi:CHAT domain-containing protein